MSPLRILVLIILFYIGFRLIVGGRKKKSTRDQSGRVTGAMPASDILEEDPVCHKLVPRHQAVSLEHNGSVVYFCSTGCCEEFQKIQGEKK